MVYIFYNAPYTITHFLPILCVWYAIQYVIRHAYSMYITMRYSIRIVCDAVYVFYNAPYTITHFLPILYV